MNKELFNTEGAIFMGAQRDYKNSQVGLFDVPYDGTTSFRPGARFGPSAIREVSNSLETYCPQLNIDLENIKYTDFGSLKIPFGSPEPVIKKVEKATNQIINLNLKPLIIGGEHSITSGAVSAIAKRHSDLLLLQLDAHADLRNEWLGNKYSHACSMKRCLEIRPKINLLQLGIRSGTRQEFQEIKENKRLIEYQSGDPVSYLREALSPYLEKPIYITIDVDWFDPSLLPGTGTPEPGGYFWNDFAALVDVLKNHVLVGGDIVELAPKLDSTDCSAIVSAKATRSLIMLLSQ